MRRKLHNQAKYVENNTVGLHVQNQRDELVNQHVYRRSFNTRGIPVS